MDCIYTRVQILDMSFNSFQELEVLLLGFRRGQMFFANLFQFLPGIRGSSTCKIPPTL